eukprot:GHVT01087303.1.p1 GENE.GHVT01087303.1~~GHVT01087303.1.p1  ORF type:complete len:345 (-),score=27.87 GHVT01087303.1:525-1559(-)
MKALILVGGFGTRLRPLTLSVPKPLIHFCNKSILEHQIRALVQVGVTHVVLAVAYQPDTMVEKIHELEAKFKVRVTVSREEEPMGTAGPIRLAEEIIMDPEDTSEEFFVCNSDVICHFPLHDMLEFHRFRKAEGTILVTKMDDPSQFGVVVHDETGKIDKFVEKPKVFVGDCINAGFYILSKKSIKRIPLKPTSIEKETFPDMAKDGHLYSFRLHGYWADIGQPRDFLNGMKLYLEEVGQLSGDSADDSAPVLEPEGELIVGNVLKHPSVKIGKGCRVGPNVTLDKDVVIGEGCRLSNCAIMSGVHIKDYTWLNETIIGWQCRLGKWVIWGTNRSKNHFCTGPI